MDHARAETETVATALAAACARHFGGPSCTSKVAIEHLQRQSGGASRQTWSFDATLNGTRRNLILRRDQPTAQGRQGGRNGRERSVTIDRAPASTARGMR